MEYRAPDHARLRLVFECYECWHSPDTVALRQLLLCIDIHFEEDRFRILAGKRCFNLEDFDLLRDDTHLLRNLLVDRSNHFAWSAPFR